MTAAKKLKRVLIMAGGTGGHVFPGLAIAKALQAEGVEVFWLGTAKGIEAQLVDKENIPFYTISISGLRGKKRRELIYAPWRLTKALWQALKIIRQIQPDLVLGMGGFVSGPGGLAAWLLRKQLIIHEQNAIAGLTNRLLAYAATYVLEAFPNTFPERSKVICTGNPVRAEIAALPLPAVRYQQRKQPLRLLVLGGSLGAAALNDIVPQALALVAKNTWLVTHQTGTAQVATTLAKYQAYNVTAEVIAFISDMAAAYAKADLVICRSGALTVAELTAAGSPALLVPYPHAVDDHQTKNGAYLVEAEGAIMVSQPEFTPSRVVQLLTDFNENPEQLLIMANAAKKLYQINATSRIIAVCQQLFEN